MIKLIVLLLVFTLSSAFACDDSTNSLDGLEFNGKLKASNAIIRIGVKGTIKFKQGRFIWTSKKDQENPDVSIYYVHCDNAVLYFETAESLTDDKDSITWRGQFGGEKLFDVHATWERKEQDFIHDMLLPKVVYFSFNPDK